MGVHGGGGEVGILVLELAVEREALLVAVVAQQRRHLVHLAPASLVRADREALPARPMRSGSSLGSRGSRLKPTTTMRRTSGSQLSAQAQPSATEHLSNKQPEELELIAECSPD